MKDRTISPGPRGAAVASAAVLLAIGGATIGSASAVTPPAPAMPTNVEAAAAPRAYPAVHAAYAQYVDLLAPVAGSRKYLVFIRSHVVDPSRGRLKGGMFVRYRSGEVRRIWTTTDQLYDAFLSGPMVVRPNCVKDSAVPVVTHPGNCSSGDRPVIDWYNLETHEAGRVQLSDRLASEEFAGAAPNGWTAVIRSEDGSFDSIVDHGVDGTARNLGRPDQPDPAPRSFGPVIVSYQGQNPDDDQSDTLGEISVMSWKHPGVWRALAEPGSLPRQGRITYFSCLSATVSWLACHSAAGGRDNRIHLYPVDGGRPVVAKMRAQTIPVVMGDGAAWFRYGDGSAPVVAVMAHDGHVSVTGYRADGVPVSAYGGVVFANPAHRKLRLIKNASDRPKVVARRR